MKRVLFGLKKLNIILFITQFFMNKIFQENYSDQEY